MREIFNEGRIVGLSQYEIYLRHILARNPNARVMTEQQWLSASLSSNMSMILRIKAGTPRGIHDYKLPENTDLCGCSTIYGSIFEGTIATEEGSDWAIRVDDYGRLIENTKDVNPVTPGEPEDVPYKEGGENMSEAFIAQCKEYIKVTGALMIQPGDWVDNIYYESLLTESEALLWTEDSQDIFAPMTNYVAAKSLEPDFSKSGFMRLAFDQEIYHDFYILFHGFSYKSLVEGEVGYSYIPDIGTPDNGDFLGPASFPWGCKVMMLTSNDVMRCLIDGGVVPEILPDWVTEWSPDWNMFSHDF